MPDFVSFGTRPKNQEPLRGKFIALLLDC
jgi:hypothetical protein